MAKWAQEQQQPKWSQPCRTKCLLATGLLQYPFENNLNKSFINLLSKFYGFFFFSWFFIFFLYKFEILFSLTNHISIRSWSGTGLDTNQQATGSGRIFQWKCPISVHLAEKCRRWIQFGTCHSSWYRIQMWNRYVYKMPLNSIFPFFAFGASASLQSRSGVPCRPNLVSHLCTLGSWSCQCWCWSFQIPLLFFFVLKLVLFDLMRWQFLCSSCTIQFTWFFFPQIHQILVLFQQMCF